LRGYSSAITRRIKRIERGDKRTDDDLDGALCSYGMIFVVENSLQIPNFTSQSASFEEVASWVLRPSERTRREPKSSRDHVIEYKHIREEIK
jgi:hypothetical protein